MNPVAWSFHVSLSPVKALEGATSRYSNKERFVYGFWLDGMIQEAENEGRRMSTKGQEDYVWGIDDGKGLADGVGR